MTICPKLIPVVVIIGLFAIAGCGPQSMTLGAAPLDSPEHHVTNGLKLLAGGKMEAAMREFNRAAELDPNYSRAYVALGLLHGLRGEYESGLASMQQANACARDEAEQLAATVGVMRIYIMGREALATDWLKQVESTFARAQQLVSNSAESCFHMGLAYKLAHDWDRAVYYFQKVLDLKNGYEDEAQREYDITRQLQSQ
jgi:tetratricopeptide (TPR) repeat protein